MRKRINDIRIKARCKEEKASLSTLRRATSENYLIGSRNYLVNDNIYSADEGKVIVEDLGLTSEDSQENFRELVSSSRRNFLKIMIASGGVLLAGSFLNKINKFKEMPLVSQSASTSTSGSMAMPNIIEGQGIDSDYESFFENFRIVKNRKEYILYNKHGDNILTIDRDT